MEGFYYDTQIQYITEIVKSNLYFAVLNGEEHKVLKNTTETIYFNTDNELLYNNYYSDFGPLNISCLYKYCTQLNGYLQYSKGLKRIVHYTTENPSKRSNAAFLVGCYTIIYLKMEPNEINEILERAGGQYREYLDASQGGSQFTLQLIDCFNAIKKAMSFNFFQFNDFNVFEYDFHDKLQNGDMNWLVPRKFLAFIGPTENEFLNGHTPEFYIKYFLDNDIRTVIRLNNKLYNASSFTKKGIDHYELFFPDGTIPSKQILLQFLEISESARAAIAVHCKAGLGRTGSLIGAYIIKHYQMTAREAIAWMRICRPGSVIGQQQGWLEKIESWLWKQGNHYRIQHFGEGDKIPCHKYGIYSKEWPSERENLIKHVQKRKLDALSNKARYRPNNTARLLKDLPASTQGNKYDATTNKKEEKQNSIYLQKSNYTDALNDQLSSENAYGIHANTSPRSLSLDRATQKAKAVHEVQFIDESTNKHPSKPISSVKHRDKQSIYSKTGFSEINNYKPENYIASHSYHQANQNYNYNIQRSLKLKKREQFEPSRQNKFQQAFAESVQQTQGDKLNELKLKKLANSVYTSPPFKIISSSTKSQDGETLRKHETSTSKFRAFNLDASTNYEQSY